MQDVHNILLYYNTDVVVICLAASTGEVTPHSFLLAPDPFQYPL